MYNNPYYQPQRFQQPIQPQYVPQSDTQIPQYTPQFIKQPGLLGKSVANIEVVNAADIPLDGSISYFPLTDGSAIITKQLCNDGTSKTVIYKPVEEEKTTGYVTFDELDKIIEELKKEIIEFKSKEN